MNGQEEKNVGEKLPRAIEMSRSSNGDRCFVLFGGSHRKVENQTSREGLGGHRGLEQQGAKCFKKGRQKAGELRRDRLFGRGDWGESPSKNSVM